MKNILFLFTLGIIAACNPDRIYEKNEEFDSKLWYVDSIPSFPFVIEDNSQAYDIDLNIRNTADYPFQNIYLTYYIEDTTGNQLKSDLMNFQLFDAKTGEPLGEGSLGDIYDHRFDLVNNFTFPQKGTYRVRLQQYMRRDSLPEVIAVGVRVDQNKTSE